MTNLKRLFLSLSLSIVVAAGSWPAEAAEPDLAAPAGQVVAKYILHVDGMT